MDTSSPRKTALMYSLGKLPMTRSLLRSWMTSTGCRRLHTFAFVLEDLLYLAVDRSAKCPLIEGGLGLRGVGGSYLRRSVVLDLVGLIASESCFRVVQFL